MSPFTVIPLGIGDAFSALHYSSCLALESGGSWILVDCPHPIRKMVREALTTAGVDLDLSDIEAVAITHLHADHSSGLEGFGYFSYFKLGHRARVLAHPDVSARLWEGHLAAGMEQILGPGSGEEQRMSLHNYFEVLPLSQEEPMRFGPFSIECRRTNHHIPTTAFRIRAGGRCLGYSSDTTFDPGLVDWLSTADLIIHETNTGVHTPYERLAGLPPNLRRRMRLIHFPDDFDRAASVIEPLRQGHRYRV